MLVCEASPPRGTWLAQPGAVCEGRLMSELPAVPGGSSPNITSSPLGIALSSPATQLQLTPSAKNQEGWKSQQCPEGCASRMRWPGSYYALGV